MEHSPIQMGGIIMDCGNASTLADFYAKLLNYNKVHDTAGSGTVAYPDGTHIIGFKTVDNYKPPVWPWKDGEQTQMMHLDFNCKDVKQATDFALECGAKIADTQYFEGVVTTMLDPAGHPFCLCPSE